jgi:hypothetical protein
MSASLAQGKIFERSAGPQIPAVKKAMDDSDIAVFNRTVAAYAVAHKQYVTALMDSTTSVQRLTQLETAAGMHYADVISSGTKVTQSTREAISADDDAAYGSRLRETQAELDAVLRTLAKEQKQLPTSTTGNSALSETIVEAKLRASAEQTRYVLWAIATVLVLLLIVSYLV